jgi:hypothetical protein
MNGVLKEPLTEKASSLKQTHSEAMMNSHLLNSLPKYIFQTDHGSKLKSVKSILKEVEEQQNREENGVSFGLSEVSEYPIELYEHQQHAIERHMSIKYEFV